MKKIVFFSLFLFMVACDIPFVPLVHAAEGAKHPPHLERTYKGMFGTYDRAALQRGFKVYREVCSACHSMNRVYFRNLEMLGYSEGQIKNLASQYTVMDGPDEEGEMFERPARPSDKIPGPYKNKNAAKASNGGAYPPDFSLLAKARPNGDDYISALLTGYHEPPEDAALLAGQYWNEYMPGHVIAMAPPLSDEQVMYEDETPQTLDQYARDVSHFMRWAADPYMEQRKSMGVMVLIFLSIFAGIMYAYKKRIWSDVH